MSGTLRRVAAVFNQAAPGANTNILATSIAPYTKTSTFRVTVVLATTSVFNFVAIQGATTFTCGLNGSVALVADDCYTFTFGVNDSTTYNFRVETDSIINILNVEEIEGGLFGMRGI